MTIQTIETQRQPYYNVFSNAWEKLLYKQIEPYLEALQTLSGVNYVESIQYDQNDFQTLFLKTWVITGRNFAKESYDKYHKSISLPVRTKDIAKDFYDQYMFEYSFNEAGDRITSIMNTNRDAMLNTIRGAAVKGEAEGLGADALAEYIRDALKREATIISKYSAERIARTEVVGASNRGQLLGVQSLGYGAKKTWLPFFDSRTRTFEKGPFNHAIQETVGLYDKFTKTGESLDHPGDPHGSAGNIINCRCSQTFAIV